MPTFTVLDDEGNPIDFDFEVFCGRCGAGLCSNATTGATARRQYPFVSIEPCATCLENEREDALREIPST